MFIAIIYIFPSISKFSCLFSWMLYVFDNTSVIFRQHKDVDVETVEDRSFDLPWLPSPWVCIVPLFTNVMRDRTPPLWS